jgi:hypothetical protein
MDYHDHTSSAMNYYEELGVSQEATGEEIRKAHRRLVKLMHPDAQLDQSLKGLAETQMRRLNSIVSTLLDADQRRAYDEQLRTDSMPYPAMQNRGAWRGIPWWLASIAGAVVLTLIAVYLWADHAGSSFGRSNRTIYVRPVENPPVASSRPYPVITPDPTLTARIEDSHNDFPPVPAAHGASDPPDSSGGISATVVNPDSRATGSMLPGNGSAASLDPPVVKSAVPAVFPRTDPPLVAHKPVTPAMTTPAPKVAAVETPKPKVSATQEAQKQSFNLPPADLVGQAHMKDVRNGGQIPPPPGLNSSNVTQHDDTTVAMNTPPLPIALAPRVEGGGNIPNTPSRSGASSKPRDPLEGEWIYAPKEPERRKPGFYPPEFIDLKLFSAGDVGSLKGQYNARYVITDKPISPEVSFQVASVDKDSRKFVWQGTNGARGTIAIHPVDDNTIRIEWRTTSSVRGPSLTSGAATLVRRQ